MLGFDFGTIGFHAKSAAMFVMIGIHVLRAKELTPLDHHDVTIDSYWWC